MRVRPMHTNSGNIAKEQHILTDVYGDEYFISYTSTIVKKSWSEVIGVKVYLDKKFGNCSKTTGKYRNMFLGETKKETQKKIDNGIYKLINLN